MIGVVKKEKGTCTTMTVGKDGKITFDNKGGSMCDTRKKQKKLIHV